MVLYEIQTSMVVEARHRPYISIRRQSLWRIPRLLQQADGVPATAFEFGSCTDGSRETWTIRSWGAAIEALSQRVCSFHHWGLGFRQYSFRLITRALRDGTVNAFGCLPLFWHALFPSGFRLQVNQMAQKRPSEFLLAAPGIQRRVPRRTISLHCALNASTLP
jgi:hypothetical protein